MLGRAGTESAVSGRILVGGSIVASVALVVTFLALGGSSYAPAQVRDPCQPRSWPETDDLQETAEQFTLSALDGTACGLHVSRETLVLALGSAEGRERFADDPRLEAAVRAGLERAIDDAERAGELNPLVADALRGLARRAPVDELVPLVEDAAPLFDDLGGLLGPLGGLLGDLPAGCRLADDHLEAPLRGRWIDDSLRSHAANPEDVPAGAERGQGERRAAMPPSAVPA